MSKQYTSRYKILVNFASRSRPEAFKSRILELQNLATNPIRIIASIDNDDEYLEEYMMCDVTFSVGTSFSKVHAINRSVPDDDWDILVNTSDDMEFITQGWDQIIQKAMEEHFPDTDGFLHFPDGYTGQRLCSLSIIGRKYYDRFGYVYHPDYLSLWCDNEAKDVAELLGKYAYIDEELFKHQHPANTGKGMDEQYKKTESYNDVDNATYLNRKYNKHFDL